MARREFQDPKIQERITPRGTELYVRYRVRVLRTGADGKPAIVRTEKRHALGILKEGPNARNKDAITRAQAEREKAAVMGKVNGQVYHFQAQIPFSDLVKLYEANYLPTLAVPTQKQYKSWIKAHITPAFGERQLCQIKPIDVDAWYIALPVADTTKASVKGVLASIFTQARRWQYVESVPILPGGNGGKKAARRVRPKRIPTPDEVRLILEDVRPDVRLILETLMWTGLRISECLGLRPRHFDLVRGVIHIEERQCRGDVDDPKSNAGIRYVPLGDLTPKYSEWLKGKDSDAYVFTDKHGEPYNDNELLANYLTYRLVKLGLKFPGFGFHTFRRLLGTWMSENGATVFELMAQLGHSDVKTTKLYVVPSVGRRGEVIEKMQREFAQGA